MRVNTVTMFVVGTVAWVVGLGVVLALGAAGHDLHGGVQICLTGIGLVVGLGLAFAQQQFGLVPLAEAESFIIDAYPVAIRALDVALIVVVAVGLCAVAALYPAARAASVEPAHAVRGGG